MNGLKEFLDVKLLSAKLKAAWQAKYGIEVIEVDQWTSTGDIEQQIFSVVSIFPAAIHGGDSEAARELGIDMFKMKRVRAEDSPPMARVWYVEGDDGYCKFWKATHDSSD
jgi:hypothetical protein